MENQEPKLPKDPTPPQPTPAAGPAAGDDWLEDAIRGLSRARQEKEFQ